MFGAPFNEEAYVDALEKSCLKADLNLFEKGDVTMLGEKGTTLSGGQKARLALARALYANADIYFLDDPISAVDAKVARRIYENAILGLVRKGKTVVLITHQVSYLTECDKVWILEKGEITAEGSPKQLQEHLKSKEDDKKEKEMLMKNGE